MTSLILRVAINLPIDRLFDYLAPEEISLEQLHIGQRFSVPFGKHTKTALLLGINPSNTSAPEKLKTAFALLDIKPLLSEHEIKLLYWAKHYYHHSIGTVFLSAFPGALRKGKSSELKKIAYYQLTEQGQQTDSSHLQNAKKQQQLFEYLKQHLQSSEKTLNNHLTAWRPALKSLINKQLVKQSSAPLIFIQNIIRETPLTPNKEQSIAINRINSALNKFSVFLLDGITGSGKTEVYLQVIEKVLKNNGQILVLLPEITLTPQLEARFKARFNINIETYHSRHTELQRQSAWLNMQSQHSQILLGTRSALFTPIPHLALIILDEEHDSSFKQQEGFRFSARDTAIIRAKMCNIPIVLGSATPSLESVYNIQQKRYQLLSLPQRAGTATPPHLSLLDIRNQYLQEGLSPQLIQLITQTLAKQEQVLIFLNRRGFAPTLICHNCGWTAKCEHCDTHLVIHSHQQKLRCHHCMHEQHLIRDCCKCQSKELKPLGLGTERVEQVLNHLFSNKQIIRLDRDTTRRKGSLEAYLADINQGKVDIILGTQMLAKGHHFPNVTLVVLLEIDHGLFSIDFHAAEKLAQLIIQVAGRSGRADKKGRVIMQTRQPDHPLLNMLIHEGYAAFSQAALVERQVSQLPPYSYQALIRAHSPDALLTDNFLSDIVTLISQLNNDTLALGPVPAPMAKRAGQFRYQLLLQNQQRKPLHNLLKQLVPQINTLKKSNKLRWSLDIDPIDLY